MQKFVSRREFAYKVLVTLTVIFSILTAVFIIISGIATQILIPGLFKFKLFDAVIVFIISLCVFMTTIIGFNILMLAIINKTGLFLEEQSKYSLDILKIAIIISVLIAIFVTLGLDYEPFRAIVILSLTGDALWFITKLMLWITACVLPLFSFGVYKFDYNYKYAVLWAISTAVAGSTATKLCLISAVVKPSIPFILPFILPFMILAVMFIAFNIWYGHEHRIAIRVASALGTKSESKEITTSIKRGYKLKSLEYQRLGAKMAIMLTLLWLIIIILLLYFTGYLQF